MSGYIGTQPVPQATQTRDSFTATSGQTSFATGGYTPNFLDVYLNGVKLAAADYTASNGSDVVLASGAATGDILEVVAFTTFNSASSSIDDNGNATAITIDISENVMLGTTNTSLQLSSSDEGFTYANNFTTVSRNSGTTAYFNRLSSDGDVVSFRKDGSTVGNIGIWNNDNISLYGNSSHAGIGCATNSVEPIRNNAPIDNSIDLGVGSARFKDAYLSGGVYLGGTGSANLLDSYEEGSFTPTLHGGFSSGPTSYSRQIGVYVKVGRLVSFQLDIKALGATANSSLIQLGGLPFTSVSSASNGYGAAYISYQESFVFGNYPQLHIPQNTTLIQFYQNGGGSAVAYNGNASDTNINARLIIVGQYLTDA